MTRDVEGRRTRCEESAERVSEGENEGKGAEEETALFDKLAFSGPREALDLGHL